MRGVDFSFTGGTIGRNGNIYYTYSNNSGIYGNFLSSQLLVLGSNNSVYGGGGYETIGAVLDPLTGDNGNYNYINGGEGDDLLAAVAISGTQYTTLAGGSGINTFVFGRSKNGVSNVVIEDVVLGITPTLIWYENGDNSDFTAYVSNNNLIVNDSANKMNITLKGVGSYDEIAPLPIFMSYANYDSGDITKSIRNIVDSQFQINFGSRVRQIENPYSLVVVGDTLKVDSSYSGNIYAENYANKVIVIDASANSNNLFISGNNQNNSVISGSGLTTIWGGSQGNDTLIGGDSKNYFFYTGDSKDVANIFGTGDRENSDVLVLANVNYSSINRDSESITFNTTDGNYIKLLTSGATEEDPILVYWANPNLLKFQIAFDSSNQMNYRDDIHTFYFNQNAQINVNGEGHTVRLDGYGGQVFINVNDINASSSYGENALIGNTNSNVIIGGNGISTLWGGEDSADDTLIGGSGSERFWIGKNAGNDVVTNADSQDCVYFYDSNLSDITSIIIDENQIAMGFNTGTGVRVFTSSEVTPTFQLADGSRYNYNRTINQWQNA